MRYMMLIYSKELPEGLGPEESLQLRAAHRKAIEEAASKGVLRGAEPLAPTSTATTVRVRDGEYRPLDNAKVTLTSVLIDANGNATVDWSVTLNGSQRSGTVTSSTAALAAGQARPARARCSTDRQ